MSESDFLTFSRERAKLSGPLADEVAIGLSDENTFPRKGKLDFVDNCARPLQRNHPRPRHRSQSGSVPGARSVRPPARRGRAANIRCCLVPDAAVVLDQSQHLVMTVAPDGTVVPKIVETGDLRGGLRVVKSGLDANDRVDDRRPGSRHARQQGRAEGRHDQLQRGHGQASAN